MEWFDGFRQSSPLETEAVCSPLNVGIEVRHEIHIRGLDLVEKPHNEKLELVERKASILENRRTSKTF